MSRIPLVPNDSDDPVVQRVFASFLAEQREPIALYRTLANVPWLLDSYSTLARSLRYQATLPRQLRQLVILLGARLTGSEYEWSHHRSLAAKAGLDEAKVRELAHWRESELFDGRERAALLCAERVHGLALDDDAFAELRTWFDEGEVIELIVLCGFYEFVARTLQGLGVEVEPAYRAYLE
ncbi:carboxymuconolactone decarboxylase family protein [Streptomyces sp. NPDC002920]